MNPESKFSRWLIESVLIRGDVQRIETTTGSGVPDINYCFEGHEAWIETKISEGWKIMLRPYQWAWMQRRKQHRCRCVVIAEVGAMVAVFKVRHLTAELDGKYMRITSAADLLINKNDPQRVKKVHELLIG